MNELICRVCLSSKDNNLTSIFDEECQLNIPLHIKMMSCTSVKINPNDNLPSKICNICLTHLNTSYQFKILCEESDEKLRNQNVFFEKNNKLMNKCNNLNKEIKKKHNLSKTKKESNKISKCKTIENKKIKNKISPGKHTNGDNNIKTDYCSIENIGNNLTIDHCSSSDQEVKDSSINIDNKQVERPSDSKKQHKEQCSTCGRIMSTRFRLRMHMRTHTGERPHSCSICGRSFTLAQSLKVHVRIHSGEKPLICTVCGKAFAQYAGLIAHYRLHSGALPYNCHICGKNFRTTGHLYYHIRKHTGEKKFECNVCHKAFIMQADLKQHIKTHTGEKRYICIVCGIRMTRSSHLTRHMLTHSKEKSHKSDKIKHEKGHLSEMDESNT